MQGVSGKMGRSNGKLTPKSRKSLKARIQDTRARPADGVVASGLAWISAAV